MATISPWLSVSDTTAAIAFYESAFGAVTGERLDDEAGRAQVANLSVDGADFWVQHDPDATREVAARAPVRMILAVADPDTAFARALAAGATEVSPVHDAHGWRVGRLADPCGHHWEVGRRL